MNSIQLREEHWVIADLVGKGGHIRTVPIPLWVKRAVDSWTKSARITSGRVFRSINKAGKIWGEGMTPKVLWQVVKDAATLSGIEKLAPHDLRRTCARCVISQAVNWIRSNSSSGTFPYKQLNDTWAVSRSFGLR
jgi:integrase